MILTENEYEIYEDFIFSHDKLTKLQETAIRAFAWFNTDGELDDYVVIRVEGYYAITKVINAWRPIEIIELVQPFDEERVYPLQRIKKKICFEV